MEYILDKQLKKILLDRDLTVANLSRMTGISNKTIYQWINGQKPRDITQICKIAKALNVSLDFLLLGTHSMDAVNGTHVVMRGKDKSGMEILLFPKRLIIDL